MISETGLEGPFLLNIDTDGHELETLGGAQATLPQCACVIVEAVLDQLKRRAAPLEARGTRPHLGGRPVSILRLGGSCARGASGSPRICAPLRAD